MSKANELTFQNDMIRQLLANDWLQGKSGGYNRELALYEEDVLGFIKTQNKATARRPITSRTLYNYVQTHQPIVCRAPL